MHLRGMFGTVRLLARTLLLAYLAAACTAYHVKTAPVAESLATPAREARVTVRNRGIVHLRDVQVKGDSLVGRARGDTARFAVPVSAVEEIEIRGFSLSRTALLTAGIALGAFLTLFILFVTLVPPNYT